MRKLFSLLLFVSFTFFSCNKNGDGITITLHNKSLPTIKKYIKGKWNLEYTSGGWIIGNNPQTNQSWTFTSNNRIIRAQHDTITTNAFIIWTREQGLFIGPDNITYLMDFSGSGVYVVDGIFNDTLVIHDNAYDGSYYHFSKVR